MERVRWDARAVKGERVYFVTKGWVPEASLEHVQRDGVLRQDCALQFGGMEKKVED